MKKLVCAAFALMAGAAVYAHGFSLSAGGGGILGGSFTRYTLSADGTELRINADQRVNQFDYGFFAFFDATFGTFSIYMQNGINAFDEPAFAGGALDMGRSGDGWESVLGFSILGRFPFRLGERFSVFPLLGMDYQITLSQRRVNAAGRVYDRDDGIWEVDKDGNAFRLSDWNSFHVRLGGGAEFDLGERLFLRGDLLYGIRLMTNYERKNLELMKAMSGDNSPRLGGLSSGPSLRLGVGYRFFTRGR